MTVNTNDGAKWYAEVQRIGAKLKEAHGREVTLVTKVVALEKQLDNDLEEAGWRIKQLEAESKGWQALCDHKEGLLTSQNTVIDDFATKVVDIKAQLAIQDRMFDGHVKRLKASRAREAAMAVELDDLAAKLKATIGRDIVALVDLHERLDHWREWSDLYALTSEPCDNDNQRRQRCNAYIEKLKEQAEGRDKAEAKRSTHRELVAALADRLPEDPEPDGRVAEAVRSRKATPITRRFEPPSGITATEADNERRVTTSCTTGSVSVRTVPSPVTVPLVPHLHPGCIPQGRPDSELTDLDDAREVIANMRARVVEAETRAYRANAVCEDAIRQRNDKSEEARNALERAAKAESELDNARNVGTRKLKGGLEVETHEEARERLGAERTGPTVLLEHRDTEPDERTGPTVLEQLGVVEEGAERPWRKPQGPDSGVAAIIGTWPGDDDEPDDRAEGHWWVKWCGEIRPEHPWQWGPYLGECPDPEPGEPEAYREPAEVLPVASRETLVGKPVTVGVITGDPCIVGFGSEPDEPDEPADVDIHCVCGGDMVLRYDPKLWTSCVGCWRSYQHVHQTC